MKPKTERLKYILIFSALLFALALAGIVSNKAFLGNINVNDLENIFGEDNISIIGGRYYYTGPGAARILLEMDFESVASKKYLCYADKTKVSPKDTLTVTIENNGNSDITNNNDYILMAKSRGHWYVIHTGKLSGETEHWVLKKGESRNFTLDLTKQGEVREITLEEGSYRFGINVRVLSEREQSNVAAAGFWMCCDFAIED